MSQQTQEQENTKQDFPIRAWLLRKSGQYVDGILINGLSALLFGGFLWIAQRFWGLRLIPFNVLDAILLALCLMIVFLLVVALTVFLIVRQYLKKNPDIAFGIAVGLFATLLTIGFKRTSKESIEKGMKDILANMVPKSGFTFPMEGDKRRTSTEPSEEDKR